MRAIAREAAHGKVDPGKIDERTIARHLYRPDMPDPDLLVRTSGEFRISNYLLWETASPSSSSPTSCGPTSVPRTSSPRSPSTNAATAASAPSDPEKSQTVGRKTCAWCTNAAKCWEENGLVGPVRAQLLGEFRVWLGGWGNYTAVMPGLYRDEGVVLRTIKLGEADRIVTVLTQGHGKVRACRQGRPQDVEPVRGAARADDRVALRVLPARSTSSPRPRRSRRTVGCGSSTRCSRTRSRCSKRSTASRRSTSRTRRSTRMLTGASVPLGELQNPVVTSAFFWKLLSLEGIHPMLDGCARCGRAEGDDDAVLVAVDLDEGGALCRVCVVGAGRSPSRRSTSCAGCSAAA